MALLRVDVRPLLPVLRAELVALLAGAPGAQWQRPTVCPGWSVHAVAAHLLGVEIGNVSMRRDHWGLGPAEGDGGGTWHIVRARQRWELDPAPARPPSCRARTTVDGALKRYARDPSAPPLSWHGDEELAAALGNVKAVLG